MNAVDHSAGNNQRAELQAVINYANILFDRGWTIDAFRIYSQIEQIGLPLEGTRFGEVKAAYAACDPVACDTGPHQPNFLVKDHQVLSTMHFTTALTPYQKKLAFKSSVRKVDIETSTQCNRLCAYCSNVVNDRRSKNIFMDKAMYEHLIDQLAEVDYAGRLSYVGHNEPMMHMDDLVERMKYVRPRLPRARLTVFTNGDYLNPESLRMLEECGCDIINMTVHLSSAKTFDECEALKRTFDKAKKLNLKPEMDIFIQNVRFSINLVGSPVNIRVRHANMVEVGHSEGDVMEGIGQKIAGRTVPCQQPYYSFIVGYNGNVHPCSPVVADVPEHAPFVCGNVGKESIFDIYSGEAYVRWRRDMMPIGCKPGACASCPSHMETYGAEWQEMIQSLITDADRMALHS